ncbi:MAG: hypothetical protein CMP38_07175 [Rickettsiales bacterium]|nr:hypothetical protein [Rickettsiales bacterium]
MKNLSSKIVNHLETQNHINPNVCQIHAISQIEKKLSKSLKQKVIEFFRKNFIGIYLYGSVGVGKSVILKALNLLFKNSEIFHFSDLIFHIQKSESLKKEFDIEKKLILIDEFYINNLTNIILFKKFLSDSFKKKKIIIMTGNKKITQIYDDPVNQKLCKDIKFFLDQNFKQIKMTSKVDYRSKENANHNFFFINKDNANTFQNTLRKQLAITSIPRDLIFKRKGYKFTLNNFYGNLIDVEFESFMKENLVFQDFLIIAKKVKIVIIRNIPQLNDDVKDYSHRFVSLIDAFYENKNILSISTRVELDNIYCGKQNTIELKRTISRLKEMGSNTYITKNLKNFVKK